MKAASLQHYVWRNKINSVIQSFHCKETQALFGGRSPRHFRAIARVAERKLAQLDAAARWTSCVRRQATVWKHSRATAQASTASASTTNGACALSGLQRGHSMSKLLTTTR